MLNSKAQAYAKESADKKQLNNSINNEIEQRFGISANYINGSYLLYEIYNSNNGLSVALQLTRISDVHFLVSVHVNERMLYHQYGSDYITMISDALQYIKAQIEAVELSINKITKSI